MRDRWSLCETNGLMARYKRNLDVSCTLAKHSSIVQFFRSAHISFVLPYAIGKNLLLCSCILLLIRLAFSGIFIKIAYLFRASTTLSCCSLCNSDTMYPSWMLSFCWNLTNPSKFSSSTLSLSTLLFAPAEFVATCLNCSA